MSAQHRTMTADRFFDSWERDGLSATLTKINGRDGIEIRNRFGRTLFVPISDCVDLAHALDRIVSSFVARETERTR